MSGHGPMRVIRALLPYTTAAAVLAVFYLAWVFASRWNETRRMERAAAAQKARANKPLAGVYGSGRLKIISFYASPGMLARGERALLCYGVENATAVRLEPPVDRVWPSLSRCVEVAPNQDTRYTLTAQDAEGHTATESFVLRVK